MIEFVQALANLYLPEEREGQGLVEYALIIVLVSIAVIAALGIMSGAINNLFTQIAASIATP